MLNSLGTAQSGLNTSQLAIENTMNNIANENTPGYVKRVTHLGEIQITGNPYGSGVEVTDFERQTNEYLYYKIVDETSTAAYYSQSSDIYGSAEIIFKETDNSGLSHDLDNYYQALESMRSDPSNEVYQDAVNTSATALVDSMQRIYTDINDLQDSLTKQTYDDVESVNKILEEIRLINEQMLQYGESPDLLDKRDALEKELSTYVDVEVNKDSAYELKVGGQTAIYNNTQNYELEVVEAPTTQKNVYDAPALNDSSLVDGETITVSLNNGHSIDVTIDTTGASEYDVKQQIADAINADPTMRESVNASVDTYGNLVVESKNAGEDAQFDLQIALNGSNTVVNPSSDLSKEATDNVYIEILDQELELTSGSLKATTENLQTNNPNNVLSEYKRQLDDLAYALSDMTSSYVVEGDTYVYGDDATTTYTGTNSVNSINLFSGSSVMSMSVNEDAVDYMDQQDLDYLASLQWKDDMNIDSSDPSSSQSFSESLQEIRVGVSANKESMDFKLDSQGSIVINLQSSLDQISKVDSDEEMINLMQYQAAYEANAKVITAVDEMIQTLLNM